MKDACDRAFELIYSTRAYAIPLDGYELLFGRDLLPEIEERVGRTLGALGINAARGLFMGMPFRISDAIHPTMVGMVKRA